MAVFIELLLIGVGLSMDAFAVSICKGLAMRRVNKKQAFVIGLFFGGFQALMPFIGWALGTQFESYITSIDHWIAFVLLVFIGGKMIAEAVRPEDENVEIDKLDPPLDLKRDACAGGGDQYRCTCGRNYIRIFELSDRGRRLRSSVSPRFVSPSAASMSAISSETAIRKRQNLLEVLSWC